MGREAHVHHGPERQPKVSKTAHPPQFFETARAQGYNCTVWSGGA